MIKRIFFLFVVLAWVASGSSVLAQQAVDDDLGRTVVLPQSLNRIVALTPSLTETLFALGLGDRVVGVVEWSDYPDEAKKIPRVGSYVSPSLESIVALRPDLVFADKVCNPPSVVRGLETGGVPVYVINSGDPFGLPEQFIRMGTVCGAPENGRRLASRMEQQWNDLVVRVEEASPVRTLLVIGNNPLISAGEETLHGKLLTMLKAENIAAKAPGLWPKLNLEYVVKAQPELVVLTAMEIDANIREQIQLWRTMPGLAGRPGYRVEVIESDLINRPGPRLTEGAEQLARVLHPELFNTKDQPR